MKYIGIDPTGGSENIQIAVFSDSGQLEALETRALSELYSILQIYSEAIVAVNSPSGLNNGRIREPEIREALPAMHIPGRNVDMRVAEYNLRAKGIHMVMTPSILQNCTMATRVGFEVYEVLDSLGYSADLTASRVMIESVSNAVYCVLAETNPLPKLTLEGKLQRQLLLFDAGLRIKDPMEFLEELTRFKLLRGAIPYDELYTNEQLDAMSAALTAFAVGDIERESCSVGDQKEGVIYLPVAELLEQY